VSEYRDTASIIAPVSKRSSAVIPFDMAISIVSGGMAIFIGGICLLIWPLWSLYGVLLRSPWSMVGLLGLLTAWWLVWRPIRAYRKARR
jgi:uncharacterized membrane protein